MNLLKIRIKMMGVFAPIYVITMKVITLSINSTGLIDNTLLGFNTFVGSLLAISITFICDRFSKKMAAIAYIIMATRIILLMIFTILFVNNMVSTRVSYLFMGLLMESIYETFRGKAFRRIKCIVLKNEKRERYDNNNEIVRKIGLLIGSGLLMIVDLNVNQAMIILCVQSVIMNSFDAFLYYKYRNADYE